MGVREEKEQVVQILADKLQNSKSTILADYRGLNVAQVTDLRKQLRDSDVEFKVVKNTLTRIATKNTNFTELDDVLVGPTAIAFGKEDPIAAAKVLVAFAKKNIALEIKGGIIEGKVVTVENIKEIAGLPSREGLISMFLSVLQAPVRNFALAVKAVAEKNEAEQQA